MTQAYTQIEIGPDQVRIDAAIVAHAFQITPDDLQQRLRDGTVTSRFEQGEGADEGRVRLTFYSDTRRVRIVADRAGAVMSCNVAGFGPGPFDAAGKVNRKRLDALLDAALDATFPASDPISISPDLHRHAG